MGAIVPPRAGLFTPKDHVSLARKHHFGFANGPSVLEAEYYESAKTQTAKETLKSAKLITRNDYPELAALKLAGRSTERIAEAFNAREESIRGHVTRAVAEYRRGAIAVNGSRVQDEARKEGEERGTKVTNQLADAVEQSGAIAEVAGTFTTTSPAQVSAPQPSIDVLA